MASGPGLLLCIFVVIYFTNGFCSMNINQERIFIVLNVIDT